MRERLKIILDPVFTAVKWLTVILLTVMVIGESYEIARRTFTGYTPAWAKEVVLLSMVWMGCLGSAYLHRERGHITLEYLVDTYLKSIRRYIMMGVDVLILLFSLVLCYGGAVVFKDFLGQSRPGTNLPVGVSYLPLAVTGVLIALTAVEHLLEDFQTEQTDAA